MKSVLKAIASEEDEPKVSVVRVPAPSCPAAAPKKEESSEGKCKSDESSKDAGKKAGKEAKKAVEKALKKQEEK